MTFNVECYPLESVYTGITDEDGGIDMKAKQYQGLFFDCFGMLRDIRQEGKVRHELTDILFIIISALFAKIDEVEEIPVWARAEQNLEWLKQYIALENGVPSLSTFRRVLRVVDPKQFEKCFISCFHSYFFANLYTIYHLKLNIQKDHIKISPINEKQT